MAKTESELTCQFCQDLTKVNAYVIPYVASQRNLPGVPDRYVHHRLWCGWIEFKGHGTKVAPLQKKRIQELNARRPYSAVVVRFLGDARGCQLIIDEQVVIAWDAKKLIEILGGWELNH